MKIKLSIILFGISFLIAILGEVYLINISQPHGFSIIVIGVVVIVTGYLFFESIWEHVTISCKKKDLLWEERLRLESEKWDIRYTELLNIQKATYVALKKSEKRTQEDIKEISNLLAQITELQNKFMDKSIGGQKK